MLRHHKSELVSTEPQSWISQTLIQFNLLLHFYSPCAIRLHWKMVTPWKLMNLIWKQTTNCVPCASCFAGIDPKIHKLLLFVQQGRVDPQKPSHPVPACFTLRKNNNFMCLLLLPHTHSCPRKFLATRGPVVGFLQEKAWYGQGPMQLLQLNSSVTESSSYASIQQSTEMVHCLIFVFNSMGLMHKPEVKHVLNAKIQPWIADCASRLPFSYKLG